MLTKFLLQKFPKSKQVKLVELIKSVRHGTTIPKHSLVVMASGDMRVRLKILDQDTPHKGFSEPLALNDFAVEHKITPNYLLWYLSLPNVSRFLLDQATGSVFIRIPRAVLHNLPVPLPTRVQKIKSIDEIVLSDKNDPFAKLIAGLYRDYTLNFSNERYRTAAVLAGAICEVIMYQLLVEHGVKRSLLKDDHSLGFKKLLDYIRVLKLDENPGFPLNALGEIQKNRNQAIHAGLLVNKNTTIEPNNLECFDNIISYFGL